MRLAVELALEGSHRDPAKSGLKQRRGRRSPTVYEREELGDHLQRQLLLAMGALKAGSVHNATFHEDAVILRIDRLLAGL